MGIEHIDCSGMISSHVRDLWLARAGQQLQRFDSKGFTARYDATESLLTQRALTFVATELWPTLIPPIKARTFIPTNVKGNPGDETYLWRKLTRTGMARLFAPGAALDPPVVGVYSEEISQRLYGVIAQLRYNYFELLAIGAALANGQPVDLLGEKMKAALEAVEKKLDLIAAFGTATPPNSFGIEVDADVGLTGLLNSTTASTYSTPLGAAGSKTWALKTGDEVLADLFGIVSYQRSSTFEVHAPDTILLPISQHQQIVGRRLSDVSGETILSFFVRTQREAGQPIEVHPWQYLTGSGSTSSDRMVAFKRDPKMLEHLLVMDATPLKASEMGHVTTQDVMAKTAGTILRYPLSVTYGDFI